MIYVANGAPAADWLARDVVDAAAFPISVASGLIGFQFRGPIEEFKNALSIWRRDPKARQAVADALGLKLHWLIEQNVPTERANLVGMHWDSRYYHAVCNALADIVRDTKVIHNWRQHYIDRRQYQLTWQEHKLGWDEYLLTKGDAARPRQDGRTGWGAGPAGTAAPGRPDQCLRSPRRLALPMHGHDTPQGQLASLEARHRAHARVEDRIRTAKQAGLGRFPSREFAINAVWLQLALTGADLIAWTQTILLTGELAKAEPKLLRDRLLHTAARIIRRGRRTFVKIAAGWPWADDLAAAFTRLAGIRQPQLA
jgi:Transposase DDE domain group 1